MSCPCISPSLVVFPSFVVPGRRKGLRVLIAVLIGGMGLAACGESRSAAEAGPSGSPALSAPSAAPSLGTGPAGTPVAALGLLDGPVGDGFVLVRRAEAVVVYASNGMLSGWQPAQAEIPPARLNGVIASPAGVLVFGEVGAGGLSEGKTVLTLHDPANGRVIWSIDGVNDVSGSNSTTFLTRTSDGFEAWSLKDGKQLYVFPAAGDARLTLFDDRRIATTQLDGSSVFRDTATGKPVSADPERPDVQHVLPGGDGIVLGDTPPTVSRVSADGAVRWKIDGNADGVIAAGERYVALSGVDDDIVVVDAATGAQVKVLPGAANPDCGEGESVFAADDVLVLSCKPDVGPYALFVGL